MHIGPPRPLAASVAAGQRGSGRELDDDVVYRFDQLTYAAARRELRRSGTRVPVGDRGLDLLAHFLRRPSQVVDLADLLRAGWDGRKVAANNVSVQVAALRRALGKTVDGDSFIRTVAGRGYMLQVPVECGPAERAQPADGATQRPEQPPAPAPLPITSFVGRRAELAELEAALADARLVTVTGLGGVGKTRLVQEMLRRPPPGTGPEVHAIDLTPVASPDRLVHALAAAVGHTDATEVALAARLRGRPVLLVLDNAEHLAGGLGLLLARLLEACPCLRALVTSRQWLNVPAERVLRLSPMPVPGAELTDAATILGFDCVRLFLDRAAVAVPGFTLPDADAALVAELCRRLDGIALAVEMLVPRLRVMSLADIADRLAERFRVLVPAHPGAPLRQRTLLTMMQWSWELLDGAEQDALRRLAVFRQPATLPLLHGLREPGGDGSDWPLLDALEGLAEKSLVTPERVRGTVAYRLLQTTRDFVLDLTAPDTLRTLRRRHAVQMAAHLEEARDGWSTTPGGDWFDRFGPAADDLRAALDWAEGADGEAALAVRLLAASIPLWWELPGAPIRSMREHFDRAAFLLQPGVPPLQLAWFRLGQSWRAQHLGDEENRPAAELAAEAARQAGDPVALGATLMRLGTTLLRAETLDRAEAPLRGAEAALRRVAPGKWLALALARLADLAVRRGATEASIPLYQEACDLAEALDYHYGLATAVSNMTEAMFALGNRAGALARLTALRRELPPGLRSAAVATLAAHLVADGQRDAALGAVEEVLAWVPATGLTGPLGYAAEVVALLLVDDNRLAAAATLAGFARHVLPSGATRFGSRKFVFEALHARLRGGLAAAELSRNLDAGAAWTQAVAETALRVECRSLAGRTPDGSGPARH